MKTWIVVVNRSEAKIFEHGDQRSADVRYLMKLENPRGRLKSGEINADKPGTFFSGFTKHGAGREKLESPTEHVAQEFAKRVSDFLADSLHQHQFEELVLIAEPQFLGRLRNLMNKDVRQCISQEVAKDLGGIVTPRQLHDRLWPEEDSDSLRL